MAKVALIGASGAAGSRILQELADRGHAVTGIARDTGRIAARAGVATARADVADADGLAQVLRGHDAVVSSVHFTASDAQTLIDAVRASGVKRYVVVGGAGSLEIAPGRRLVDQPDFPAAYKAEATKGAEFLELLRGGADDLEWTFISPSAVFAPGRRTGEFRLGRDQLLTSDAGSSISFEDFAIALVDELERPAHVRQRFTVGY